MDGMPSAMHTDTKQHKNAVIFWLKCLPVSVSVSTTTPDTAVRMPATQPGSALAHWIRPVALEDELREAIAELCDLQAELLKAQTRVAWLRRRLRLTTLDRLAGAQRIQDALAAWSPTVPVPREKSDTTVSEPMEIPTDAPVRPEPRSETNAPTLREKPDTQVSESPGTPTGIPVQRETQSEVGAAVRRGKSNTAVVEPREAPTGDAASTPRARSSDAPASGPRERSSGAPETPTLPFVQRGAQSDTGVPEPQEPPTVTTGVRRKRNAYRPDGECHACDAEARGFKSAKSHSRTGACRLPPRAKRPRAKAVAAAAKRGSSSSSSSDSD